jgi:hypothetical protein
MGRMRVFLTGCSGYVGAVARSELAPRAPREDVPDSFNTGDPQANYLVRDLALIVAGIADGAAVTFGEGAGTDRRSYKVDFPKIASVLPAFRCRWDAWTGAESLALGHCNVSMHERPFRSDRFTRLVRLRSLLEDGRLDGELRWHDPATVGGTA